MIMIFPRVYSKIISRNIRKYSNKVRPKVELVSEIENDIENKILKPRKHPGIFKPRTINLPNDFIEASRKALADYPVKQLLTEGIDLINYLKGRHPPIEQKELVKKKNEIETKILSQHVDLEKVNGEELYDLKNKLKGKINVTVKSKIYAWKPIEFDMFTSLQYLLTRTPAEYAALVRIFQEIYTHDKNFKPKSFFDFGSGVGTALWAANLFWQKSIFEYFCVDSSKHMNDLASILLKGGTGLGNPSIKGIYYRQFLPVSRISYDLVVSAYSLLELPSTRSRLETVLKLWNKTQQYLIIVEQGTNAGFKILNEARDFILQLENNQCHVFSPCPHDASCERFLTDTTPCNFPIMYQTIPVGQISELRTEFFTYVVLKRGPRLTEAWPRVVRPVLVRSKHVVCRMCMPNSKLDEVIFTAAKHGRISYCCAKACRWGDMVPVSITSEEKD